ncbi:alpha/beta-hydrolase [Gymnopilus junonius]|uniref:Alpha/beta-hydrolase n=1 Tax=Gymnopilus junonius TaxID=109634 RepID=A0A9P5TV87_GYMJU|nr:alpha/beta-hydrolase [Gymnopilus junonius]
MPTVDLHSKDDYASIYYTTNTPYCNVGGFDPEKPPIVILPPAFLDSTWTEAQMGDSRLNKNYNIIAFDMRSSGKSICRPSGRHDSWVDAADLAFCFQILHLPPSHILALEGTSVYCALRFAVLFPELCLSLTLVNVPAPSELKWIYQNIDELVHAACFSDDLEPFQQATFECIEFLFGPNSDADLVDDLVTFWETTMPPSQRVRTAETTSLYINRSPMDPEACSLITQPVLVIQGEKNELCPKKYAEALVEQLTGVPDGAVLYEVKGGRSMISVVPGNASIVNNVFFKFLGRLPHYRSDITPPTLSLRDRMKIALNRFSEITGMDITSLDPLSSLSFSCVTDEVMTAQTEILKHYQKGARDAFTPTAVEGSPPRRYSQRDREEWSYTEKSRLSINSKTISLHPDRINFDIERIHKSSLRSEIQSFQSSTTSGDAPLIKGAFSSINDKQNGKRLKSSKAIESQNINSSPSIRLRS